MLAAALIAIALPVPDSGYAADEPAAAPTESLPQAQRRMRAARDDLKRAREQLKDAEKSVKSGEENVRESEQRLERARQKLEQSRKNLEEATAREAASRKEFDDAEAVIRGIYDSRNK
jgi:septal ring factor EnvC (AmiA/AmiB activator)